MTEVVVAARRFQELQLQGFAISQWRFFGRRIDVDVERGIGICDGWYQRAELVDTYIRRKVGISNDPMSLYVATKRCFVDIERTWRGQEEGFVQILVWYITRKKEQRGAPFYARVNAVLKTRHACHTPVARTKREPNSFTDRGPSSIQKLFTDLEECIRLYLTTIL